MFLKAALAAMRDRAPVNTKALQTVSVLYPEMLDVGCIPHFLDRVGTKCNIPVLKQIMTTWKLIFTTSMKGRRVWKEVSGKVMLRYNATRWWSYWECSKVVFEEWRHITAILDSNEEFADTSRQRLSQILMQDAVQLRVELASLMELEMFVKATYTLEGDGHLIFIAFQKLEELRSLIHVHNFPVILGVVQELFPLNIGDQQRWYQYGLRECVTPPFQYILNTLANDLVVSRTMKVFRAAQQQQFHEQSRYLDPQLPTSKGSEMCRF